MSPEKKTQIKENAYRGTALTAILTIVYNIYFGDVKNMATNIEQMNKKVDTMLVIQSQQTTDIAVHSNEIGNMQKELAEYKSLKDNTDKSQWKAIGKINDRLYNHSKTVQP